MRVHGIERLRDRLEQLPDEIKAGLRDAVREAAEAIRDDVRRQVPVDTGRLRSAVGIDYRDEGLTARVGWSDPAAYYARFVEFGTSSQPAKPSLGTAAQIERSKLPRRVRDEVRRSLPS